MRAISNYTSGRELLEQAGAICSVYHAAPVVDRLERQGVSDGASTAANH